VTYAGIVTRGIAIAIDAALINLIAVITGAAVNLVAGLFGSDINFDLGGAVVAGAIWFIWVGSYFTFFWDVTGQTPGSRVLGIRVISGDGRDVTLWQALRRFGGLVLCVLSFGIGFLPVLVDKRRRGLHDMLAGTVVQWVDASVGLPPQTLLTRGAANAPGAPPPPGS
jgi:uncharacterized RDD family membrane protein YckC